MPKGIKKKFVEHYSTVCAHNMSSESSDKTGYSVNLEERRKLFINAFVSYVKKELVHHHNTAKGSPFSWEKAVLGRTSSELAGFSSVDCPTGGGISAVFAVGSGLKGIVASGLSRLSKKRSLSISNSCEELSLSGLTDAVLKKVAENIFDSFELHFAHITSSGGVSVIIERAAEDAGERALDHIYQTFRKQERKVLINSNTLEIGVILGQSGLFNRGIALHFDYGLSYSSRKMYTKAGLAVYHGDSFSYYSINNGKYGYRLPISYERNESPEDLIKALLELNYNQDPTPELTFQRNRQERVLVHDSPTDDYSCGNVYLRNDSGSDLKLGVLLGDITPDCEERLKALHGGLGAIIPAKNLLKLVQSQNEAHDLEMQDIEKSRKMISSRSFQCVDRGFSQELNLEEPLCVDHLQKLRLSNKAAKSSNAPLVKLLPKLPVTDFVGRKEKLCEIHTLLNPSISGNSMVCICGIGGVGKTQLALQYVQKYFFDYPGFVVWIDASGEEQISSSLATLLYSISLSELREMFSINSFAEIDKYVTPESARVILRTLCSCNRERGVLLIFDNAQNYNQIQKYLPSTSATRVSVIITSRFINWGGEVKILSLGVFSPTDAKQFVVKALEIKEDYPKFGAVYELVNKLGYFPLALRQSVAYIAFLRNVECKFSIRDYLVRYHEKAEQLLKFEGILESFSDQYNKTIFTTWSVSIDHIGHHASFGKKAIMILNVMAYLYCENIPNKIFTQFISDQDVASSIHLLRSYSMIDQTSIQDMSCIHSLVQMVTRSMVEREQKQFKVIVGKVLSCTSIFESNDNLRIHYISLLLNLLKSSTKLLQKLNLVPNVEDKRLIILIAFYANFPKNLRNLRMSCVKGNTKACSSISSQSVLKPLFSILYRMYSKSENIEILGEALFFYIDQSATELVTEVVSYLDDCIEKGLFSFQDLEAIASITHNKMLGTSVGIKGLHSSSRRYDCANFFYRSMYQRSVFFEDEKVVPNTRKVRQSLPSIFVDDRCLQSKKISKISSSLLTIFSPSRSPQPSTSGGAESSKNNLNIDVEMSSSSSALSERSPQPSTSGGAESSKNNLNIDVEMSSSSSALSERSPQPSTSGGAESSKNNLNIDVEMSSSSSALSERSPQPSTPSGIRVDRNSFSLPGTLMSSTQLSKAGRKGNNL